LYSLIIFNRVVHAKGAGAYGEFEVTHDITSFTSAAFLNTVGKKTRLFTRFSTVGGEKGSADSVRDGRGFAFKLYTEEGNLDWLFFNLVRICVPVKDVLAKCPQSRHSLSETRSNCLISFMLKKGIRRQT